MGTVEQASVEILLQLPNLESDRWLSHMQCFGCLGETQQSGNGMENLEPAIAHRVI
jgi:hypothetical protein